MGTRRKMYKLSKSVDNAHDDAIWTACWTSKRRVLTASVDATLELWDPTTLSSSEEGDGPVLTLTGHDLGVIDAAVAPDGVRAVSTGFDSVRVWDLDSGACTGSMASGSVEAWAVAIDPFAGTNFAVSSHAGGIGIYAVDSMEPVSSLEGAGKKFGLCLAPSPFPQTTISSSPLPTTCTSTCTISWAESLSRPQPHTPPGSSASPTRQTQETT